MTEGKSVHTPGAEKLTDHLIRKLAAPATGNRITYDRGNGAVRGFGVRVTAGGSRSFIVNYVIGGRERRLRSAPIPNGRRLPPEKRRSDSSARSTSVAIR
jgi:hypothetical protein